MYHEEKLNELSLRMLLEIKNTESDLLNDASDKAWNDYSEIKTMEAQEIATKIQTFAKQMQNDVEQTTEYLKENQAKIQTIKDLAKNSGHSTLELEQNTIGVQEK